MFLLRTLFISLALLTFSIHAHEWNKPGQQSLLVAGLAIDREQIPSFLQRFVDSQDQKSFRHLGVHADFFHGHYLYTKDLPPDERGYLRPFAILYHTQEDAFTHHHETPGDAFDYLDRHARSWVQFFPLTPETQFAAQTEIQNAYQLMADFFPDTEDFRASLRSTHERFSVSADQLDFRKFPESHQFRIVGQRQLEFDRVDCATAKEPPFYVFDLGIVRIVRPGTGETVCLTLSSFTGYIPVPSAEGLPLTLRNDAVPANYRKY